MAGRGIRYWEWGYGGGIESDIGSEPPLTVRGFLLKLLSRILAKSGPDRLKTRPKDQASSKR